MRQIKITLTLIWILVLGAVTYVTGQIDLPSMDLNSPVRNVELIVAPLPAPTPPIDISVPDILKDPKLIAVILAKLEAETARANSLETKIIDTENSRDQWKQIADKEKLRGDELERANVARQSESIELRASRDFLRQSVDEYKIEVADLRKDLSRARGAQKWWGIGGLAAGFGVCQLARSSP